MLSDFKIIETGMKPLNIIKKCMLFVERNIRIISSSDDESDDIGISFGIFGGKNKIIPLYKPIKFSDLKNFIKRGSPSESTLEDMGLHKLTNIIATYFHYIIYDIFTYDDIKEICENLENHIFFS